MSAVNMLTIDVEDWFQVENLKSSIQNHWDDKELRVEANTDKLLDMLDRHGVKATFFVLGWIAERVPGLVKRISAEGHEIASHGCSHELIYDTDPQEFRDDLRRSKIMLEDLTGKAVIGYRAPSFSITDDALCALSELGFVYDSSYFEVAKHDRYGKLSTPSKKSAEDCLSVYGNRLFEIPMATVSVAGKHLPISGGGYFRLLPFAVYRKLFARAETELGNCVFYIHPWECDPGQPRVRDIKASYRFRHYVNLNRTEKKLDKLLDCFNFTSVSRYLALSGRIGDDSQAK